MSAMLLSMCLAVTPVFAVQVDVGTSARPQTASEDTFAFVPAIRVALGLDADKRDTGSRLGVLGRLAATRAASVPLEAGGFFQVDVFRPVQLDTGSSLAIFLGFDGLARYHASRPNPWSGLYLFTVGLRIIGISIGATGGFEAGGGNPMAGVLEMRLGVELLELIRSTPLLCGEKKAPW